ncbi:MAG TPA: acyltransferase [Bryobacteraceae bacterium]|jgi:peptidoglycan/LPS O-acetylase OafA/YrhL
MNTTLASPPAPSVRSAAPAKPSGKMPQYPVLDGWRAISILLVLAGHMLPLGPARYDLNGTVAAMGMSIFFTLSGFLITNTLIYRSSVPQFLIRRFCRILPLAWLATPIALLMSHASASAYPAHFLFYANLPPFFLTETSGHLWSLCVEMQFYITIAFLFGLFGRRGLWGIPVLSLLVTAARIATGTKMSIVTYLRADEILAGGCLALAIDAATRFQMGRRVAQWSALLCLPLFLGALTGRQVAEAYHLPAGLLYILSWLRPYIAAALVGGTLVGPECALRRWLSTPRLRYIAHTSYAIYIVHPLTTHGWLGSGSAIVKYAKRPLCFALTFALAHLSTNYYEAWWIDFGKRMAGRLSSKPKVRALTANAS